MIGLLGKKLGMTHTYDPHGRRVSVTAVLAGPCTILRVRETATDTYSAVQLGFESVPEKKLRKDIVEERLTEVRTWLKEIPDHVEFQREEAELVNTLAEENLREVLLSLTVSLRQAETSKDSEATAEVATRVQKVLQELQALEGLNSQ